MTNVPSPTHRQPGHAVRKRRLYGAMVTLVVAAALIIAPAGSAARRSANEAHMARLASEARPGRAASVPPCPAGDMVAWVDTNGNGAAGTIFYKLHFTNLSGHRCTLRGYPGVSAASVSGHGIGPGATRLGTPVRTVTLNRGAAAVANVGIVEAGNFPPARCRPTTAAGLRVFVPGATLARFVPFPFAACTRHVNLRISPVAAH